MISSQGTAVSMTAIWQVTFGDLAEERFFCLSLLLVLTLLSHITQKCLCNLRMNVLKRLQVRTVLVKNELRAGHACRDQAAGESGLQEEM